MNRTNPPPTAAARMIAHLIEMGCVEDLEARLEVAAFNSTLPEPLAAFELDRALRRGVQAAAYARTTRALLEQMIHTPLAYDVPDPEKGFT